MVKTLIITIILIAVAVVALGVKIIFTKGGKFPSGHAHEIESRRREALQKVAHHKRNKNINL